MTEILFSSEDWYKPNGNNEWSFGSDQDTTEAFVADAFQDLFLKIRYIKWGDKRDPFSFAFGNYNQVTLGHGILMLNYDNNSEFPAVRKVGLSLSAKGAGYGFEMVGEDFSHTPEPGNRRPWHYPFSWACLHGYIYRGRP
jgi:hypothetical protein